jgi:hypothetical protein
MTCRRRSKPESRNVRKSFSRWPRASSVLSTSARTGSPPSIAGDLPLFGLVTDAAGLMAYAIDDPDLHARAAMYVDKILKGSRPSDLAVQQLTKFKLVINLKTAKALGLTIPPSLQQRADQVIE